MTELMNSDKKIVAAQRFHFVQIFILWIDCAHKCTSGNLAGQRKSLSYLTGLSGCAKFRFFSVPLRKDRNLPENTGISGIPSGRCN